MAQKGFKILDHPADLGIEAFGKDLKEAFEQSAVALMSIILDISSVHELTTKTVGLDASDYEHMLVKWLTEVLYLYDGQHFVATGFRIEDLTPTRLTAAVSGEILDLARHATKLDVKAITYHQLSISQTDEGAKIRVFLDI